MRSGNRSRNWSGSGRNTRVGLAEPATPRHPADAARRADLGGRQLGAEGGRSAPPGGASAGSRRSRASWPATRRNRARAHLCARWPHPRPRYPRRRGRGEAGAFRAEPSEATGPDRSAFEHAVALDPLQEPPPRRMQCKSHLGAGPAQPKPHGLVAWEVGDRTQHAGAVGGRVLADGTHDVVDPDPARVRPNERKSLLSSERIFHPAARSVAPSRVVAPREQARPQSSAS